jgi:hypothetical protein
LQPNISCTFEKNQYTVSVSKLEKLIARFKNKPKDFSYDELCKMLKSLGYTEDNQGKTSGSRVCFYNDKTGHLIRIHKPHPSNMLKKYQIELILENLGGRKII